MSRNFEFHMIAGNTKAAMKAIEASSADLWKVQPDKIKIIKDYNPRFKNEKYHARVRWIADSIKTNGFYNDKPLKCFVAEEDGELVLYLVAGHRRLEGALLAISEGYELPFIPCVITPRGVGEEELNVDLVVGNEGDPLTVLEQAVVCKRLSLAGWEPAQIASKLGFKAGAPWVNDLLNLSASPIELRKFVENDLISATKAIELLKKHGVKAAEIVRDALAKNAGAKVTGKSIAPKDAVTKQVTKQAPALFAVVHAIKADVRYVELSADLRSQVDELLAIIADASAPKGKKK